MRVVEPNDFGPDGLVWRSLVDLLLTHRVVASANEGRRLRRGAIRCEHGQAGDRRAESDENAPPTCGRDGLSPRMRIEFSMEPGGVNADGLRTEEESSCDLPVREAFREKSEDVEFARRRLVAIRLSAVARLGRHARPPREIVGEGPRGSRAKR
jgi:hypothetical protein